MIVVALSELLLERKKARRRRAFLNYRLSEGGGFRPQVLRLVLHSYNRETMASISPQQAIKNALAAARVGTYEAATTSIQALNGALALYAWNAQVSAALMAPLHVCEVVVRNAVADALTAVYGPDWPWSPVFATSLPQPTQGYSARGDLMKIRAAQPTTGKVIPELKFVFWQTMFTSRFDVRIWHPHLRTVMPHLEAAKTVPQLRGLIYSELDQLRKLRNRIAHHEPIFRRNLADDFQKIQELIALRCPITSTWMVNNQQATALIGAKPP